jgi:hypothetical protein
VDWRGARGKGKSFRETNRSVRNPESAWRFLKVTLNILNREIDENLSNCRVERTFQRSHLELCGQIMIFRLEIANFYSVREPHVIDLRVARNAPLQANRFAPIHAGSADRAPKVVAFFGANASGKSTVLRALAFLSWFVQDSFGLQPVSDQPPPGTGFQPCERFRSLEALNQPTRLCVHFTGAREFTKPPEQWKEFCRYAYEVQFESAAGRPRNVVHESIRQWPGHAGKSVRVFERNQHGQVLASKEFGLGGFHNVIDKVRSNCSVISTLAQFDHKASLLMRDVARTVFSNIFVEKFEPTDDSILRTFYAPNQTMINAINRDIDRIDLGIRGVRIMMSPAGPVALFDHDGLSDPLPMHLESHGTRQFIRIYPGIAQALLSGGVAVVDELDYSIHPLVLPEIIGWFHDPERNPQGAQLWLTCQAASLLEDLQKEEVFFCEKSRQGQTRIYGLQDIAAVRRSDNLYKKYLGGMYGGVPHLG